MQQLVEQDAAMMSASGSAFSSAASAGSSAFSSVTGSVTSSSKGSAGGSLLAPSSSGGIARASSMLSAVDDVDEGSSGSASKASSVTIQANSATNNTNEQEDVDLDDLDEDEESVDGQSTPPRTRTPTQTTTHSREGSNQTITPPPLPPKDTIYRQKSRNLNSSPPVTPLLRSKGSSVGSTPSASASNTGSITSTIANAMRYVLNPLVGGPETTPSKHHHHALLATHNFHHRNADPAMNAFTPIDDRPHIKYDFTLGKRLKFSCTVYFARQFDMLRKRCGVDGGPDGHGDIVKSLARCVGWEAEGGKSKSSFLKSEDDRFIIKTLVNAWNVADLQVLLELSASYFRYMDQTSSHASVLAKLMGFYTIEIKNLETGQTNGRADLLVMENLFYGFKIEPGRTFDLKGIAGRKVKPVPPPGVKEKEAKAEGSGAEDGKRRKKNRARPAATAVQRPLFDGEWIEGMAQIDYCKGS
ncbi:hypothetical protein FRC02_007401 [Tulasnella sp. 418]|nr:hypothetical protein FRC02_007401 [Tulasnella sp. 418]